jgi:hypothetical protein
VVLITNVEQALHAFVSRHHITWIVSNAIDNNASDYSNHSVEMWIVLIIAGLGIGGILVPASIITTIVCPDDLIATVSALTLSIRVIGGGMLPSIPS